ncbi:hypothetical protein B7R21_07705 [Subtercola boreus]|uniref:DUF4352 domain-containing protein n=1 Tax=Subtercola boreus TaxID=120213 RepID=A0A3E0VVI8_9MICO|nr:hypothetical protein [Subtercola boreus]RFA13710.1 hypothetical protein B7R21_07705 [Subtercola boreus]
MSRTDPSTDADGPTDSTIDSRRPKRRGWLRRNAFALAAIIVLVPLTLGITFSNEWVNYYSTRPSQPVVVDPGQSTDFAGTGWAIEGTERISSTSPEGREADLPGGSDLVVVTVSVTPRDLDEKGESPFCEVRLEERDRGELARSWGSAEFEPIDYDEPEGVESGCTTDRTAPYKFEAQFVVPSDTTEALALHLEVGDELPKYLSLTL